MNYIILLAIYLNEKTLCLIFRKKVAHKESKISPVSRLLVVDIVPIFCAEF